MLRKLRNSLVAASLTSDENRRIDAAIQHVNSAGFDDWGLDPETVRGALAVCRYLYHNYFRVETHGLARFPAGRALVVANHGGQLPIDGLLIGMSLVLAAEPPRIARGMVERWATALPFVSTFFSRCGQIVGDHRNCRELLDRDEIVMVFPEGVRGSGKTFKHRYELQKFGNGFVRLALETKSPIVPVAVIGCEETYPSLSDLKPLANLIGIPYIPITPLFPWLGLLGAAPLPTKVTLRYGEPIYLEGDPDASEAEIDRMVEQVKSAIRAELDEGLRKRGSDIFHGSGV